MKNMTTLSTLLFAGGALGTIIWCALSALETALQLIS